jgi:hypothetical protein
MGKKAKSIRRQKRADAKRALKAANKARYAAMRDRGENSKSKRFIKNSKRLRLVLTVTHPEGKCYNIGCKTCDPCDIHK